MLREVPSVDCGELVVVGGVLLFIQYRWSTQWQWDEMGQEAEGEEFLQKRRQRGAEAASVTTASLLLLQLNRGPERENCETYVVCISQASLPPMCECYVPHAHLADKATGLAPPR
jgi:hypothetical protein